VPQKVMIVEDNVLNMRLFNDVIESRGYEVIQSVDGVDVIPLAHEHSPDLIIMDIQLPVFSGVEITHNLKQDPQLETMPVVAVTAFARYGDRENFYLEDLRRIFPSRCPSTYFWTLSIRLSVCHPYPTPPRPTVHLTSQPVPWQTE
jgi:two-component system cell cycle response regulator DivK